MSAHRAMITLDCGRVKLVRTMKGDRSVMTDVPAAMTTSGTFASVASGATASAVGVTPNPASRLTLLLTINSCASRLAFSATAPLSR